MAAKISIIVAHDDKLGIGAHNRLLWNITKDLNHFRQITLGHPVVMGRKTYESIGHPLPGRKNIIITRDQNLKLPGCLIVHSLEEAIFQAGGGEIFIIGGAEIYAQAMKQNLVDRLYITHVHGDFQADVFFPDYSRFKTLISQTSAAEGQYQFEYQVLEP